MKRDKWYVYLIYHVWLEISEEVQECDRLWFDR